jgi:hypothetical protein
LRSIPVGELHREKMAGRLCKSGKMVPVEGGGLAGTVSIVGRGKTLRLLQEETHGAAYEWTFRYCWYCIARLSKCSGRRSGPGCILDRKLKSGGGDRA